MKYSAGNMDNAWVLPAAFNHLQYINDRRYLEGDATARWVQEARSTTIKVEFEQNIFPDTFFDSKQGNVVVVKTVKNIELGEELFDSYGSPYLFAAVAGLSRFRKLCLL